MTDQPEKPESIWQPLDGSAPPRPAIPGSNDAPLSFTKPDPRPLAFPAAPAPALPGTDPRTGQSVFVLSTWWPRAGAYVLDNLIFSLSLLLLTVPAGMAIGMTAEESLTFFTGSLEPPTSLDNTSLAWVIFGVQVALQGTLPAIFLVIWSGQTPGKRIVGIRVVAEDGSKITFGLALRRELVFKTILLGMLTVITLGIGFVANYLWPLRDAQNRAGQDFFAKTRVVTAPRN